MTQILELIQLFFQQFKLKVGVYDLADALRCDKEWLSSYKIRHTVYFFAILWYNTHRIKKMTLHRWLSTPRSTVGVLILEFSKAILIAKGGNLMDQVKIGKFIAECRKKI